MINIINCLCSWLKWKSCDYLYEIGYLYIGRLYAYKMIKLNAQKITDVEACDDISPAIEVFSTLLI